ncbi:S9 family peptidase [Pseudofulvimonas gallinarii]|uniref:Oligopeptidase B n=1 Tax=Pseudofulvimonas gallinarii TaxID=634155 RepID=A0A4S3L1W6_9GAMM|nr:oligopeptidase B [Pseudofulvimonas gallinarii]THD14734.1 oligopeptidase B [Pseudofulvimonas gallinarii]
MSLHPAVRTALLSLGLPLLITACQSVNDNAPAAADLPPVAERIDHVVEAPAGSRTDPYYWLRDDSRSNEKVLDYLRAENAWFHRHMERLAPRTEKLYGEIVGRIKQDDSSVPVRHRGYWYYVRFAEGQEYPVYARRRGDMTAPEEILLDGNTLAEGHGFFQIGDYEVSDNGRWLVWAEDTIGRRQYVLRFKDLETGTMLDDRIEGVSADLVWAADDSTLFYIENDPDTLLGKRVKRHRLGTPTSQDVLVYEEPDESYYLAIGRTGDERFLVIHSSSTVSDELRYVAADQPQQPFTVLAARERDFEYDADHIDNRWIIRTNWQAPNFRLMEAADSDIADRGKWRELVGHRDDVYIEEFELFRNHLAIGERSEGLKRVRIRRWDGAREDYIGADEAAYVAEIDVNSEQDSEWLRYSYSSLTTPESIYEVHMDSGERRLLKRAPVLGGFDSDNYVTERTWATAADGEKIPVSLLYRKGFQRDGSAALYQYAYGSYGMSMDPYFSTARLSLVDRGMVFAIAHIRGGEEMGRRWYEAGKLLDKRNTFTDFIAVTDHLVAEGYVARDRVAAMGGSAGGLLIGAVANLAPEKYRVLVAHVPFVDVVTTMLDESIPLTTNEYDEWGNPAEKAYYDYMLSYSPYDNVRATAYPAMLVTTGLWDSQVQYWEPAKWVAKLRATATGAAPLLYKTNMEAGHGGKSGRFQRYRETAEEYAFVLDQLGVAER